MTLSSCWFWVLYLLQMNKKYIYCVVTVPNPWYSYSCYMYNAVTMTWADAELHCVSEGPNLVSIQSEGT